MVLMQPRIIEGKDVDVLSPFPARLIPQAVQWLRCHPTLSLADNSPKDDEGLTQLLEASLATQLSYGIVDKNNLSRVRSTQIPVVGLITVQELPPWGAYVHISSNRRAWGAKLAQPGLLEQGSRLVMNDLFETHEELLRINALHLAHNAAAGSLCRRLGFRQDGLFPEAVLCKGEPKAAAHYGITRTEWRNL